MKKANREQKVTAQPKKEIFIKVDEGINKKIQAECERLGKTKPSFVRSIIEEYFQNYAEDDVEDTLSNHFNIIEKSMRKIKDADIIRLYCQRLDLIKKRASVNALERKT